MRLIVKQNHGEEILAVTDDTDTIRHFFIARPERLNLDDTLAGIIRKREAVLNGYFVETDKGSVFVHSKERRDEGEHVYVKITKEARLGKDANGTFITALEKPQTLTQKISTRFALPVSYHWDETLDEALENTLSEKVSFADGAKLHIVRTPACWTIDVDSGNSATNPKELNQTAAQIIAKEIILRHIGGLILIDFIGTKQYQERIALQKYLIDLLKKDTLSTVMGWTKGKLFEIRRTRTYAPLIDVFLNNDGRLNDLSVAYRICALTDKFNGVPYITAHPQVIELLRKKINNTAILQADITYSYTDFDIKEKK